eukprot:1371086-Lingulodinium_polyedra.AAC.1
MGQALPREWSDPEPRLGGMVGPSAPAGEMVGPGAPAGGTTGPNSPAGLRTTGDEGHNSGAGRSSSTSGSRDRCRRTEPRERRQ